MKAIREALYYARTTAADTTEAHDAYRRAAAEAEELEAACVELHLKGREGVDDHTIHVLQLAGHAALEGKS